MTMFYYSISRLGLENSFLFAIPFIFIFLVILSWWVCFSLSTMIFFHRQRCWLLCLGYFLGFLISHECDPLTLIAAYIQNTLLSDHIFAIYLPSEAWLWTRPLQWRWHRQWRLILQLHRTSIPSSCCWQPTRQNSSWIIIQQWLSDSSIRPGSLYDSAALIAPENGTTLRASVGYQRWCPVRLGIRGAVQFFVGHRGGLKTDQLYYRIGSIFQ